LAQLSILHLRKCLTMTKASGLKLRFALKLAAGLLQSHTWTKPRFFKHLGKRIRLDNLILTQIRNGRLVRRRCCKASHCCVSPPRTCLKRPPPSSILNAKVWRFLKSLTGMNSGLIEYEYGEAQRLMIGFVGYENIENKGPEWRKLSGFRSEYRLRKAPLSSVNHTKFYIRVEEDERILVSRNLHSRHSKSATQWPSEQPHI